MSYPLDSIKTTFNHRSDSIQKKFASPLSKFDKQLNKLSHKRDSLSKLNLSTKDVTHQRDSVSRLQREKTRELNASIENLKQKTLEQVSSLQLPQGAQGEISKLSKSISSYAFPADFFKLPGINGNTSSLHMPSLQLPSNFSIPSMSIPSLQKLDIKNIAQLPSLEKYKSELAQVNQLKSKANAKELEKLALKEASQLSGMKELQGQEGKLTEMKSQLDKAKEANPQQAAQMAVNHFAGKEQQLKSAMDQVAKYKQKYSSVKSLAELPKRPPNPLKGKPWYEHTQFGINYFVMNKSYTMIDFNPYVAWRFTPHLSASIGWNERIGISHWNFHTNKYDRVFGLRAGVNYTWTRGIVFKLAPEVMSAFIPVNSGIDAKREAAVLSIYAGVRKDFPVYKKIKGYSEVLYDFTQSPGKNLYGDPLVFRFGLETTLQKKKGQNNPIDIYKKRFKAITSSKDSLNIFRKNNLFGVTTTKGDTLIKPQFDRIEKFMKKTSPYFIVVKDNKHGAIDNKGLVRIRIEKNKARQVKRELLKQELKQLDFNKIQATMNHSNH